MSVSGEDENPEFSVEIAIVRFKGDRKDETLAIEDIREIISGKLHSFTPKDNNDFNPKLWYAGAWECSSKNCTQAEAHTHFFKLQIIALGNNKEELEEKLSKRRVKRAKLPDTDSYVTSEKSSNDSDGSLDDGLTKSASKNQQKNIAKKLQSAKTKENIPPNVCNEPDDPHDETNQQRKKEPLERPSTIPERQRPSTSDTRQKPSTTHERFKINQQEKRKYQWNAPRKSAKFSKFEVFGNPSKEKETEEERERRKASSSSRSVLRKYKKIPERHVYKLNVYAQRYDTFEDDVYLGLDVYYSKNNWRELITEEDPETFLRNLADIIWTAPKLANRALQLGACKYKKLNPFSPRKELEKDKLQLLSELYEDYLETKGFNKAEISVKLQNVRNILRSKIQDNRPILRQHVHQEIEKRQEEEQH